MKVKIKDYRGIGELDAELEEGKINFIYGPSGSGKSSLTKALLDLNIQDNVMFGKENAEVVITPDIIDKEDCSVFNETTVQHLLLEKEENNDFYRIIFSNGENIEELREEAYLLFAGINSKVPELRRFVDDVDNVMRKINGRSKLTNDEFSKNSLINKLEGETLSDDYVHNCNTIRKNGINYIKWLETGCTFEYYENERCPFCRRKLTDSRKSIISKILNINLDNYKMIFESEDYLRQLDISIPNYSSVRELNKTKRELKSIYELRCEVYDLLELLNNVEYNNIIFSNFNKFKYSKEFETRFPEIAIILDELSNHLREIIIKVGIANKQTRSLINKNIKDLNMALNNLSIPYNFFPSSYDKNNKKASFILKYINDTIENEDRREFLSYGEKNIIALLLFLYSKHGSVVIIDDPASSYDENRRRIITDLILKNHSGETIIVLSHDQVFIKYAILAKQKQPDKIGGINCIENYGGKCKMNNITKDDFDSLDNQIIDFIHNNPNMKYYRKIINLRLLAEISSRKNKIVYGYLSAILHGYDRKFILKLLKEKGKTERFVLKYIDERFNIKLEKIPKDYKNSYNYDEFTLFEKAILIREELKVARGKGRKSNLEKELDDVVHLNTKYCISLNPYFFNTFTTIVYNEINKYEGEM